MSKKSATKSNLKIYITFTFVMLLSLIGGFLAGRFAGKNKDVLASIDWNSIAEYTAAYLPVIYAVLMVVLFVAAMCLYFKVKQAVQKWDREDETVIDDIENRITWLSMFPPISIILSIMLFSICICAFENAQYVPSWSDSACLVTFAVSIALYYTVWKITVDLEKKLNPEKKGNPFDFHFIREWENSSDEGEILMQSKACQKGFLAGQLAGLLMWIVSFTCMLVFHTGVLAVICCCSILLCMYLVYGIELVKLQK